MAKVLVVDDDKESRDLLLEVLSTNGYAVAAVENAAAARSLLETDQGYGIVIADLLMPNGTGIDLARDLRRRTPRPEIILMSSFISGAERELALNLGVDSMIEKPFRLSDLLELVAGLDGKRPVEIPS